MSNKTIKGENTTGQIIFGILDAIPILNIHDVIKSINKKHPNLPAREKAKLVIRQLDPVRSIVAIIIAILIWKKILPVEFILTILN